ncbi:MULTISPECIES: NAD(P)/FAD-dependent oxidoreductase [unclassified Janthinobacterium]|uniref:NAD(P)/FAD-dependent oxidoreductase n=1 Tax=unclassified Janthinobacterium TaxID=2610881 RepID=UPI00160DB6F6|nr:MULTISPECIES: NAD(P)/FAD-dependent oxidoreductase [unclassified Janthinobacterium]MBB5609156.1 NADH dehydrogenase [Janthinobacterium sp. S3T4]MBB5614329.1 NADH dehydrogenase [Janthinobacterium sp. S3M3]
MHSKILIVGGGAGGLELACKLSRKLGPGQVTLVDSRLYHIWKPSLHEVAAGTLDIHQEGLSYQMLAHDNGFTYVYGPLMALDAAANRITVGAIATDKGEQLLPERQIGYEQLVLAVGSTSNYFGVPGAKENTISLNATEDAERFRLTLLKLLAMAEQRQGDLGHPGVDIVIIGGGATGVELAAELREASGVYAAYGFQNLNAIKDVRITLLEGAPRILAPLPERVSRAALKLLNQHGISVATDTRVTSIEADKVTIASGTTYAADICVWAAGIRAPEFLSTLGLPTNRAGQLEVTGMLNVQGQANIYALGDCAACAGADGKLVPPRAQAAHQQADYLLKTFLLQVKGKPPQTKPYEYLDYGSLVSFGRTTSVGTLMGSLKGLSWFVEGFVARMMYVSLHLMHHKAVLGSVRTGVMAMGRFLIKRSTPQVKLH